MVTIVEVPPPASADDRNVWAARAQTRLWNAESVALLGYADLTDTEEAGVRWAVPSAHRMSLRWIALTDPDDHDTVVGCGTLQLTLKDNLTSAGLFVVVTPGHRRRGIGSQLFSAGEQRALAEGRTTMQSWASQPGGFDEDSPTALTPQEGTGAIDGDSATARFMLAHGYRLEQVEVHSMLRVPVDRAVIDPLEADAAAKVGDAYRLVGWAGRCPDELVDAFARLRVAMADAPTAGLEYEAEHWDAARVREVEQRVSEGGLVALTTAAQHVASGELVGYTHLERFADRIDSAFQEDTVVVAAHRGHRLGMWLKTANLRRVAQEWPHVRRIHTWNADENDHMRSINIALGFRTESAEGIWQKVVKG